MPTPNGGLTSYCTPAQFLVRYDWRTVADYLSDNGVRLTEAEVLASPKLAALLAESSGELEALVMAGRRYSLDDLTALTGNSAETRDGIIATRTILKVWARRPDKQRPVLPEEEAMRDLCRMLAEGEAVFALYEHQDAGLMKHHREDEEEVMRRNGTTVICRRFFGRRGAFYDSG